MDSKLNNQFLDAADPKNADQMAPHIANMHRMIDQGTADPDRFFYATILVDKKTGDSEWNGTASPAVVAAAAIVHDPLNVAKVVDVADAGRNPLMLGLGLDDGEGGRDDRLTIGGAIDGDDIGGVKKINSMEELDAFFASIGVPADILAEAKAEADAAVVASGGPGNMSELLAAMGADAFNLEAAAGEDPAEDDGPEEYSDDDNFLGDEGEFDGVEDLNGDGVVDAEDVRLAVLADDGCPNRADDVFDGETDTNGTA